jgi:tetratricopeptide (TPR) repeat protein
VDHPDALSLLEQDFLEVSRQVAEKEAADAIRLQRARQIQRIMIGVTLVLVAAVAYLAYTFLIRKTPAVMDGFYNIAVAGLAEGDPAQAAPLSPAEINQAVGEMLSANLQAELGQNPNILIWRDGPDLRQKNVTIGPISGEATGMRAGSAVELANRLGADMIIFPVIQQAAERRLLALEFVVVPRPDNPYEDLQGGIQLNCSVPLEQASDPAVVQAQLSPCANALAYIALGLTEGNLGHSLEALEAYLKAAQFYPDLAFVHFLAGREYLFLVDRESVLEFVRDEFYKQSEAAFKRSIALDAGYPRAHIGLGSVYYKQARDLELEAKPDSGDGASSPEQLAQAMQLVDQSIAEYGKALDLAGQNASGVPVDSIARQGQGNALKLKGDILLDQGQAEQARLVYEHAVQALEPTIEPFEQAGQARYLAQSYEYLGSTYLHLGYISELGQAYQDGLTAYQLALKYLELCIAQGESTQDFVIKTNVVAEICQPNREFVQQRIALLGGTQ